MLSYLFLLSILLSIKRFFKYTNYLQTFMVPIDYFTYRKYALQRLFHISGKNNIVLGPLVATVNGKVTLVGAISFRNFAQSSYSGVYSRVTAQKLWILANSDAGVCQNWRFTTRYFDYNSTKLNSNDILTIKSDLIKFYYWHNCLLIYLRPVQAKLKCSPTAFLQQIMISLNKYLGSESKRVVISK